MPGLRRTRLAVLLLPKPDAHFRKCPVAARGMRFCGCPYQAWETSPKSATIIAIVESKFSISRKKSCETPAPFCVDQIRVRSILWLWLQTFPGLILLGSKVRRIPQPFTNPNRSRLVFVFRLQRARPLPNEPVRREDGSWYPMMLAFQLFSGDTEG